MTKLRLAAASAALLALASAAWGQGVSISNLPAATTPLIGTELSPVVQSSTTKKATVADLVNLATQPFTGLTFNKVTITAPATGSTLTIADGKTLTASNTLTFTGTDASSVAFGTGGTAAYTQNNLSVFAATTSAQLAGVISNETGSGVLVFATSPTLVTPVLGVASATSINKVALTAPASGSTLTVADGKTLTASNTVTLAGTDGKTLTIAKSLTLDGTDSTTLTFPSTSATIARTDAAQSFTGTQTFSGQIVTGTGLPTIANGACGAGANGAVAAGSTNQSGQITIGASATTTCTIVFSATLGAAPKSCHIQPANAAAAATGTTVAYVSSITTAQFVITGSALASANYGFFCL